MRIIPKPKEQLLIVLILLLIQVESMKLIDRGIVIGWRIVWIIIISSSIISSNNYIIMGGKVIVIVIVIVIIVGLDRCRFWRLDKVVIILLKKLYK